MLEILYADEHLLVINKPAGLLCHPVGTYQGQSLLSTLRTTYGEQVCLPHRLDQYTSGLIIAARDLFSLRRLYHQFAKGRVKKTYLGVVHGCVEPVMGEIELPLGPAVEEETAVKIKVVVSAEGKIARTRYRVLASSAQASLLLVEPLSGRKHQIRVHLASIGHPILGDKLYLKGGLPFLWEYYLKRPFPWEEGQYLVGHALHANSIAFCHPMTTEPLSFDVPLPRDIQNYMVHLGLLDVLSEWLGE